MRLGDMVLNTKKNTDIEKIYSSSEHERLARTILNEVLDENPKWFRTIYTLSILTLLVWRLNEREKSYDRIRRIASRKCSEMNISRVNKVTESVTGVLCSFVTTTGGEEGKCLRAIFLSDGEVSRYVVSVYLKKAVTELCSRCSFVVEKLYDDLRRPSEDMSSEERYAFHDIDSLYGVCRNSRKKSRESAEETETKLLLLELNKCLVSCETYSEDAKRIVDMYIRGYTENEICKNVNRSRTYVRNRIGDAKEMMAVYLWGVATNKLLPRI